MNRKKIAVVGSGFTGAIIANRLSDYLAFIDVYESRDHIGGNCYTYRDEDTGILIHKYGPHIFHTDNEFVWNYVNELAEFIPFTNRVKTTVNGKVYSLPINLHTINQFFDKTFSPEEAKEFIQQISDNSISEPQNFEEQGMKFVGKDLYEAFFKGYTLKQWGIDPKKLPASILKRLPLRFNYNDNYFAHQYQGMPKNGYTPIFQKLLSKENIRLHLKTKFPKEELNKYDHVFFTGPIDSWFDFSEGRLGYRTLDFKQEKHSGDFQGCAVMNYGDIRTAYTRITEHKHFAPEESFEDTIIYKEYSRLAGTDDDPYYPIRLVDEKTLLRKYIAMAEMQSNVSFLGRLGTYRYLDMDVTISEALDASNRVLNCIKKDLEIPTFFVNPI